MQVKRVIAAMRVALLLASTAGVRPAHVAVLHLEAALMMLRSICDDRPRWRGVIESDDSATLVRLLRHVQSKLGEVAEAIDVERAGFEAERN